MKAYAKQTHDAAPIVLNRSNGRLFANFGPMNWNILIFKRASCIPQLWIQQILTKILIC